MGTLAAVVLAVGFGWVMATPEDSGVAMTAEAKAEPTWPLVIDTVRQQGHHVVRVALVGPNGETHNRSLLVDTGATEVVLPSSMIKMLGFKQNQLQEAYAQTANGVIPAWRGRLKTIELGGPDRSEVLPRINVMFIDDDALGGAGLLGMNVLGKYNVTFLDSEDQILLDKRR